ncbi:MAG: hypothetical protein HXM10_03340, partial [Fusobacterium periodonticum]|nr:hypothetical protein [Fusobacterium periodonticum]
MSSAFTGFVLLNEAKFDKEKFLKDLKEDWKITLDLGGEDENKEKDMLVGNIGDIMVAVALMPAPIPNNEAVENAKTNYRWPDAVKVAEEHKAHILVSLLGEPDLIEGAKLYTKIVSALTKQENCTGINVLGTVLNPGMYRDFTKYYEEKDMFPVENMIFIGLYAVEDNKVSAYTYG